MSKNRSPLKYREFLNWLKSKEPGEVVGIAGRSMYCPIASYLSEKGKEDLTMVRVTTGSIGFYYRDNKHPVYKTPEWAANFVERLDTMFEDSPVTTRAALRILRERNS